MHSGRLRWLRPNLRLPHYLLIAHFTAALVKTPSVGRKLLRKLVSSQSAHPMVKTLGVARRRALGVAGERIWLEDVDVATTAGGKPDDLLLRQA